MSVTWVSAFLDLAPDHLATGTAFWAAVTGYDAAAVADAAREFPPLRPPAGAPYLWVQRVGDAPSGVHVDVHVDDLDPAVRAAESLGAVVLDRRDHVVLRSPAGLPFCLVGDPPGAVPAPSTWHSGHRSRVDRVAVAVPTAVHAAEVRLWAALRPAERVALEVAAEPGAAEPVALLEVGTTDRAQEVERHLRLGAAVVASSPDRDELVDPGGVAYRIVHRHDAGTRP